MCRPWLASAYLVLVGMLTHRMMIDSSLVQSIALAGLALFVSHEFVKEIRKI